MAPATENLLIIAVGRNLGTVTINHNRGEAIKSALAAATHGEYRPHIFVILNMSHIP